MKPTNPMAQLAEWKKNHAQAKAQAKPQPKPKQTVGNASKNAQRSNLKATKQESKSTLPPKQKTAEKSNQGVFLVLPQNTRNFQLIKDSVNRCKAEFPDCFHHKLQLADECQQLAAVLNQGAAILQNVAKKHPLADTEREQLKQFRQVAKYLAYHFNDVRQHVKAVQDEKTE